MLDRKEQPAYILPDSLDIPEAGTHVLENGIRLWSIDTGTQPLVRLSLVFKAGTRYQKHSFAASSMLNLMSEGTQRFSAAQIAELFDFYGIYYDTSIDRDFSVVTISCLTRFLPKTLEILGEILLRPRFDPQEIGIYTSKRKQQLIIERQKPAYQARELFAQALFGAEHPYGKVSPASAYDELNQETVRNFYRNHYHAENLFAVASGQLGQEQCRMIVDFLGKLPAGPSRIDGVLPPPRPMGSVREHREGALQSSVRIGRLLFPRTHPDFNGMQILSTILGGYFGSRLVKNLREDKGYTYGIYSAMIHMEHCGYLAVATDVQAQATDHAVAEIFREIERMRAEPVPASELDMVRNILVGEMMRILDGPFGIADVTIDQVQAGMGMEALEEFFRQVKSISARRLQELAVRYLDPKDFVTVIVGE